MCGPLRKGGYIHDIDEAYMYDSKSEAVAHIFEELDKDICRTCEARIFLECKTVEGPK